MTTVNCGATVVADASPLLVFRNIVAVDLGAETLDIGEKMLFNHLGW
jgi:hypothetical protein